jgi:hypothetical protein
MNPPPGACRGTPSLFVFRNSGAVYAQNKAQLTEQPWKHACPERFRKNIPETIFSQAMSRMKNISVVLLAVKEKIQKYRFINIEKP